MKRLATTFTTSILFLVLTAIVLSGCTNTSAKMTAAKNTEKSSVTETKDLNTNQAVQSISGAAVQSDAKAEVTDNTNDSAALKDRNEKKIVYENKKYGFKLSLPQSWKGYKIITDKWTGVKPGDTKTSETGPLISIRHPLWTREKPHQDIPVMVITLKQWDAIQKEELAIGAAPIGPTELGRNSRYVFALPARYNFAFPEGYEEVEKIIQGKPLEPIEVK